MSTKALRNEHPYAIEMAGDEILFHRTNGSGVRLLSLITGGLAFLMFVNGLVQLVLLQFVAGGILLALGTLFGFVATIAWRKLRSVTTQTVTLAKGALRVGDTMVALADDLQLQVQVDWTDGMGGLRFARVVSLRWQQGKLPIYKSYDKDEIEAVRRCLADHGIR